LAVACLFVFNDIVSDVHFSSIGAEISTLAPSLTTKPLVEVQYDEKTGKCSLIVDDDAMRSDDPAIVASKAADPLVNHSYKKWAYAELAMVIGQMLKRADECELENPKGLLIDMLKEYIKKRDLSSEISLEGYRVDGIEEVRENGKIKAFRLPIRKPGAKEDHWMMKVYFSSEKEDKLDSELFHGAEKNVYVGMESTGLSEPDKEVSKENKAEIERLKHVSAEFCDSVFDRERFDWGVQSEIYLPSGGRLFYAYQDRFSPAETDITNDKVGVASAAFCQCVACVISWRKGNTRHVYTTHYSDLPFSWMDLSDKMKTLKETPGVEDIKVVMHTSAAKLSYGKMSWVPRNMPSIARALGLKESDVILDIKPITPDLSNEEKIQYYTNVVATGDGVAIHYYNNPELDRFILWDDFRTFDNQAKEVTGPEKVLPKSQKDVAAGRAKQDKSAKGNGLLGRGKSDKRALTELCELLEDRNGSSLSLDSDIESSRIAVEEILKHDVERVMVVGNALTYVPVLLAFMGKKVVFVDQDPTPGTATGVEIAISRVLGKTGIDTKDKISFITAEIGTLDLASHGLEPNSFDVITFFDLIGGIPVGDPMLWMKKSRELLKEGTAYLFIDEDDDAIRRPLELCFSQNKVLAGGKRFYAGGMYNLNATNRFYEVENENLEEFKGEAAIERVLLPLRRAFQEKRYKELLHMTIFISWIGRSYLDLDFFNNNPEERPSLMRKAGLGNLSSSYDEALRLEVDINEITMPIALDICSEAGKLRKEALIALEKEENSLEVSRYLPILGNNANSVVSDRYRKRDFGAGRGNSFIAPGKGQNVWDPTSGGNNPGQRGPLAPEGKYEHLVSDGIFDETIRDYRKKLQGYGSIVNGKRVLDLGTGIGQFAFWAEEAGAEQITGIDRDAVAIKMAKRLALARGSKTVFKNYTITDMNDVHNGFDVITAALLWESVPESRKIKALQDCFDILPSGGKVLFLVHNDNIYSMTSDGEIRFEKNEDERKNNMVWTHVAWEENLLKAGFTSVNINYLWENEGKGEERRSFMSVIVAEKSSGGGSGAILSDRLMPDRAMPAKGRIPGFGIESYPALYTHSRGDIPAQLAECMMDKIPDTCYGIFLGDALESEIILQQSTAAAMEERGLLDITRMGHRIYDDELRSQFMKAVLDGKDHVEIDLADKGWKKTFDAIEVHGRKFIVPNDTDLAAGLFKSIFERAIASWEYMDLPGKVPYLVLPVSHLLKKKNKTEIRDILSGDYHANWMIILHNELLYDNVIPGEKALVTQLNSEIKNAGTLFLQLLLEHELRHEHPDFDNDETECAGRDADRIVILAREYEVPVIEFGALLFGEGLIDKGFFERILRSFNDLNEEEQKNSIEYMSGALSGPLGENEVFRSLGISFIARALDSGSEDVRSLGAQKLKIFEPVLTEPVREHLMRRAYSGISDFVEHEDMISKEAHDLDVTGEAKETIELMRETSEGYGVEVGAAGIIVRTDGTDRLIKYLFDPDRIIPLRNTAEWKWAEGKMVNDENADALIDELVMVVNETALYLEIETDSLSEVRLYLARKGQDGKPKRLMGGMPLGVMLVANFNPMDLLDEEEVVAILTAKSGTVIDRSPLIEEGDARDLFNDAFEDEDRMKELFSILLSHGYEYIPVKKDWDMIATASQADMISRHGVIRFTDPYKKKVAFEVNKTRGEYTGQDVSVIMAHTHPFLANNAEYCEMWRDKAEVLKERVVSFVDLLKDHAYAYDTISALFGRDVGILVAEDPETSFLRVAEFLKKVNGGAIREKILNEEVISGYDMMVSAFNSANDRADNLSPSPADIKHTQGVEQEWLGGVQAMVNWDYIFPYRGNEDDLLDDETSRGRYYYRLGNATDADENARARIARHVADINEKDEDESRDSTPAPGEKISVDDLRPVKQGLLAKDVAAFDMAVKNKVNLQDKPLVAIYGGSGADISNFLLSTNATEAYFVDQTEVDAKKLEEYIKTQWNDDSDVHFSATQEEERFRNQYFESKKISGYTVSTLSGMVQIECMTMLELDAIGARRPRVSKGEDGTIRLTFLWAYPGNEEKEYLINFVPARVEMPCAYPTVLRNRIERKEIDIYYQHCGINMPLYYPVFLPYMATGVRDGGFMITDDYIYSVDLPIDPCKILTDLGCGVELSTDESDEIRDLRKIIQPDGPCYGSIYVRRVHARDSNMNARSFMIIDNDESAKVTEYTEDFGKALSFFSNFRGHLQTVYNAAEKYEKIFSFLKLLAGNLIQQSNDNQKLFLRRFSPDGSDDASWTKQSDVGLAKRVFLDSFNDVFNFISEEKLKDSELAEKVRELYSMSEKMFEAVEKGQDLLDRVEACYKRTGSGAKLGYPESERIHAMNFRTVLGYITGKKWARAKMKGEANAVKTTKEMSEPRIIAVGKSWIKGYEDETSFQFGALNPLMTYLKNYCEKRNIPFIVGDDNALPGLVEKEREKRGLPPNTKVVMLAGVDQKGVLPDAVKDLLKNKLYTIVGIDSHELAEDSYIRIMEILTLALKLSIGIDPSLDNAHMDILPPGSGRATYIIVPHAEPVSPELLNDIYRIQRGVKKFA